MKKTKKNIKRSDLGENCKCECRVCSPRLWKDSVKVNVFFCQREL